jgi:hypothetical protein
MKPALKNKDIRIFNFLTLPQPKRLAVIMLSIVLPFSLFFLMPMDIFLHNAPDFVVTITDFLLPNLAFSIVVSLVLFLILATAIRGKALDIVCLLLFGLMISAYIQVLFLNGSVKQITGADVEYANMSHLNTINYIFWLIITVVPLCVWKGLRDKKKEWNWEKTVFWVLIIIFGMLSVGVVSSLPLYRKQAIENPYYLSYSETFNISKNENIVVFMMDNNDIRYTKELFDNNSDLKAKYDGFTLYTQNTSEYTRTFLTLPKFLTGYTYDDINVSLPDFKDKIWEQENMIDKLKAKGYITYLSMSQLSSYNSTEQLIGSADNIKISSKSDRDILYKNILKYTLYITAERYLPYLFKSIPAKKVGVDFSNEFVEWHLDNDNTDYGMTEQSDEKYFYQFNKHGLSAVYDEPVFSFQHLCCSHDDNFSGRDNTKKCYETVADYIGQLKSLGVYDNTTIIIIADHPEFRETKCEEGDIFDKPYLVTLMLKPKNSEGAFQINDTAELSNAYFNSTIYELVGLPEEKTGHSYFDVINNNISEKRYLQRVEWVGFNPVRFLGKYEIKGDANNFDNWKPIEQEP